MASCLRRALGFLGLVACVLACALARLGATYAEEGVTDADLVARRLEAAAASLEQGRLREADGLFADAGALAREDGRLEAASAALFGRIRALVALYDVVGLREANRDLLEVQIALGDEEGAAQTRVDLGYIETSLGAPTSGLALLREALAFYEAKGDEGMIAACRVRMSLGHQSRGEFAAALDHAEAAERTFRRLGDDWSRAEALRTLGNLSDRLGLFDRAKRCYQEELSLLEGAPPQEIAVVHGNLGTACLRAGRLDLAEKHLKTASGIFEELGDRIHEGVCLAWIGRLHEKRGQAAEALRSYRASARLAADDPEVVACARIDEGRIHLSAGRPKKALQAFEEAAPLAASIQNAEIQSELRTGLARTHLMLGDHTAALEHLRHAYVLLDEVVEGLSPVTAILGRGVRHDLHDVAIELAVATRRPEVAFEMFERSRSHQLRRRLDGPAVAPAVGVPAELTREAEESRARLLEAKVKLVSATASRALEAIRAARDEYRGRRQAYDHALASLQRHKTPDLEELAREPLPLGEAQASLASHQALLLYAMREGRVRALLVRPDVVRLVDLGARMPAASDEPPEGAPRIVDAIRALDVSHMPAREVERRVARLRRALFDPLGLPPEVREVFVSPDAELGLVPFGLLAQELDMVLAPSGTAQVLLARRGVRRGARLLALGDPQHEGLMCLPASREEVLTIAREGDTVLIGEDATEQAWRDALGLVPWWTAVHFACHGLLDERDPNHSALALTPGPKDDGLLTAMEVFGLRVPADLVVLSACETARGPNVRGEGMVGLARAFLAAGAPRVIASLWSVDDEATRAFMTRFYASWRAGSSASHALALARRHDASHERWRHPRYWAAWTLWGDPGGEIEDR